MIIIGDADTDYLHNYTRQRLIELKRCCLACQMKQIRLRRFMFALLHPAVEKFNHRLQIDGVTLIDEKALHVIDVGANFRYGGLLAKMDANTT